MRLTSLSAIALIVSSSSPSTQSARSCSRQRSVLGEGGGNCAGELACVVHVCLLGGGVHSGELLGGLGALTSSGGSCSPVPPSLSILSISTSASMSSSHVSSVRRPGPRLRSPVGPCRYMTRAKLERLSWQAMAGPTRDGTAHWRTAADVRGASCVRVSRDPAAVHRAPGSGVSPCPGGRAARAAPLCPSAERARPPRPKAAPRLDKPHTNCDLIYMKHTSQ